MGIIPDVIMLDGQPIPKPRQPRLRDKVRRLGTRRAYKIVVRKQNGELVGPWGYSFRFRPGKWHGISEQLPIHMCTTGFHTCPTLKDAYNYIKFCNIAAYFYSDNWADAKFKNDNPLELWECLISDGPDTQDKQDHVRTHEAQRDADTEVNKTVSRFIKLTKRIQ